MVSKVKESSCSRSSIVWMTDLLQRRWENLMHRWICKQNEFTSNLKTQDSVFMHLLVDELGEVLVSHLFDPALAMVELEDQKLGTLL